MAKVTSIYADYNSTTPLCQPVIDAFNNWQGLVGNLSSQHQYGQSIHAIYDESVDTILHLLNATDFSLFTCSSATEANHWFFYSLLENVIGRPTVIASSIEHPCVLEPLKRYNDLGTINLKLCRVKSNGIIDLDHLDTLLTADVFMVSIMYANNEIGTIQPMTDVVKMAHSVGAIVHSDIVQAAGKIDIDLNDLNVDAVSISSHKCYAPVGCGALLVKRTDLLRPMFLGGSQQQKLRAGTVNVLGLNLFAKGLEYCYDQLPMHLNIHEWGRLLIDNHDLIEGVVPIDSETLLWNTLPIAIKHYNAHDAMMKLDLQGVAVATGSACSTGAVDVSPVMLALKLPKQLEDCVIRLSFGYTTGADDLAYLAKIFNNSIIL